MQQQDTRTCKHIVQTSFNMEHRKWNV